MPNEVVMLAKDYNPSKMQFPAEMTEKYDGFASRFYKAFGAVTVRSRQDKPIPSAEGIRQFLKDVLPVGCSVLGELIVPGLPFRVSGGIIRRQVRDDRIVLMVYDFVEHGYEDRDDYQTRQQKMLRYCGEAFMEVGSPVRIMEHEYVYTPEEADAARIRFMQAHPEAEGVVFRPMYGPDSLFRGGKRSWGMQRWKPWQTLDLQVLGYEEGVGEHTGMVGGVIVRYNGKPTKAGAGKMNHAERRALWEAYCGIGKRMPSEPILAEIKFKDDPAYDGLREGTFQRWRTDKDEADE